MPLISLEKSSCFIVDMFLPFFQIFSTEVIHTKCMKRNYFNSFLDSMFYPGSNKTQAIVQGIKKARKLKLACMVSK